MGPLVFAAVTFVLLWVLFILPQQRRLRAHQGLVSRLQAGDEVMTTSGLFGTILDLDDEVVELQVAEGVVVRVARSAVGRRLGEEQGAEQTTVEQTAAEQTVVGPTDDSAATET